MPIVKRVLTTTAAVAVCLIGFGLTGGAAHAQIAPAAPTAPVAPAAPTISVPGGISSTPTTTAASDGSINIDFGGLDGTGQKKPGQSVIIILLLTLLSIAPALLVTLTSFTRIVIVLSLTRNALGLTAIPPNQVVIGLSVFLSLFVMAPTISSINKDALQPLLAGKMDYKEAYDAASAPLKKFMLGQTRRSELSMMIKASGEKRPATREKVSMTTLVPAFLLSELKTAFIIGFIVFVPFLIIDLVVSSALMSMGMFMLPPVLVSLPFKLLLFVMVDGWALVVKSLITSFH